MRAQEFITELFQQTSIKWDWSRLTSNEANARFDINNVPYIFEAYKWRTQNLWEIEFRVDRLEYQRRTGTYLSSSHGITGTGNAALVMATVSNIIQELIVRYVGEVDVLAFTADEPSRQSLYLRMIKRLLPTWDIERGNDGKGFIVRRPKI